jgi:hypothetical protein
MRQGTIRTAAFLLSSLLLGCVDLQARDYRYDDPPNYYPEYRPRPAHRQPPANPVVRRDYYNRDRYAPDGTYHSEDVQEDRRASYYSPGRNKAITPPKTTVESIRYGADEKVTREHTSWIGADGKPHSTTIERDTVTDAAGDTHTDTHVTLRRRAAPPQ